jgi:hypothetical protein
MLLLVILGSVPIFLTGSVLPVSVRASDLVVNQPAGIVEEQPGDSLILTSPGPGSRVRAPLKVLGDLNLEQGEVLLVELRGKDGRLLVRHLHRKGLTIDDSLKAALNFQLRDPEEAGRLLLISRDIHQRTSAVNSVDLILSAGAELILPAADASQSIQIHQPTAGSYQSGGNIIVSGTIRTETEGPLHIELVNQKGGIIGQRLAGIAGNPGGDSRTFTVEVPYSVSEATPVRVLVYEDGGLISPVRHLTSLEVILEP